jgi:hypothetical protein
MANPEGQTSITGTARLMPATFYIATTPLSGHTAITAVLEHEKKCRQRPAVIRSTSFEVRLVYLS